MALRSVQTPPAPRHEADVRLMRRVADGDAHARRVLATRLVMRVRRHTAQLLRSRADAEDAAQLALVEILQAAGGYRGQASVESWSARITARTALRFARKQRVHREGRSLEAEQLEERLPSEPPPASVADRLPRRIESYLALLSDAHRRVLVLKLGFDYTVEEIAETLDLPEGTVKGRLVAARRKLRALIRRDLRLHAEPPDGPHPRATTDGAQGPPLGGGHD